MSHVVSQRRLGTRRKALKSAVRIGPIYMVANMLSSVRFVVQGDSMIPAFTQDQYLMVSRLAYSVRAPSRSDVVVFQHPAQPGKEYIKRIIGLPGEHLRVERERVFINDTILEEPYVKKGNSSDSTYDMEWLLDDDGYFVIGDNRSDSQDSRSFGPIKRSLLIGKAWLRYWPPSAWGLVRH